MKPFDLGDCLKAAEKARKMYSMAHNTSQTQTDWDEKERTLLQKFSTLLPPYFMRVHRSYIVNLHQITEVSRFRILFGKDTYIPIGENYKEQFMAYIQHTGLL